MKRNKWFLLSCLTVLMFLLASVFLSWHWKTDGSRFSRKVEENIFSLGMERLNDTLEETFSLQKEDTIDVSATLVSG